MAKNSREMREWAVMGAEQRLVQLAEEAARIYQMFPELRERKGGVAGVRARHQASHVSHNDDAAPKGRRRRKMSAEARKLISEAQKKRWAKQRQQAQ